MSTIKAIMLGALLQITVSTGLTVYLFNHTNDAALQYAQLAERNANQRTVELVQAEYNRTQILLSQEREDIHAWVDKRIDLKIHQAMKEE